MKNKAKRKLVRNERFSKWGTEYKYHMGYDFHMNHPFNVEESFISDKTYPTEDLLTMVDNLWKNRLKQVRNTTPVIYTSRAGMEWYHKMFEDYIKQHFPKKIIWI